MLEVSKEKLQINYNIFDKLGVYKTRQTILVIVDTAIVISAFLLSLSLTQIELNKSMITPIAIYILINTLSLLICKGYSSLWNDSGDREFVHIAVSSVIYVFPLIIINRAIGYEFSSDFYIINTITILLATCGSRIGYRGIRRVGMYISVKRNDEATKVLIIGGGSAGSLVIEELYNNPQLNKKPIGIIDDNKSIRGRKIHNVPVLGNSDDIEEIVRSKEVDEIIFSIANITGKRKQDIIKVCKDTKCTVKTIPGICEIIDGKVDIKKIRDVNIEDLLGREPIKTNIKEISGYIENQTILVTGGGGSIGSELCRQIVKYKPKKLIILDIYENNAYDIQQELIRKYGKKLNLDVVIASVREEKRLDSIFNEYRPDVVFHAAAHKHVPLMEKSPCEAIKNNIFGTGKVAKMADKYKVKRFVLISTDKAVNPTNIMGATKRCAEMIIQAVNENSSTEFVAVRFGNVLGSNGSVIPLFKKQIEQGGPVTVTHPEVTRYFMTIPEAVELVMQAGAMAKGGEIFVLNMGESMKILDLAKNLISLSGFEPDVDIKIEISGLRPGEKLYEELLMDEEGLSKTNHNKIFIGKQIEVDEKELKIKLETLNIAVEKERNELIEELMKDIVPTFVREEYEDSEIAATN